MIPFPSAYVVFLLLDYLITNYSQEIKFGDNDTLSAITASMLHADYLFLLTDVDGLYTTNPRKDMTAKPIDIVSSIQTIRAQGEFFLA